MNRHAFLPGDLARVKIMPRWRLWAYADPAHDGGGFHVTPGGVVIVIGTMNVDDAYSYVIVDGKHAFMKTARLEPA